jgi:type IV secretion system protein VirB11
MTHPVTFQLAPLAKYLDRSDVFEVRINRYHEVVCDTFGGREFFEDPNITAAYITNLTKALANKNGIEKSGINDVSLPGGVRGIILLPPAVVDNTVAIAFRKDLAVNKSLEDLDSEGVFEECKTSAHGTFTVSSDDNLLLELYSAGKLIEFLKLAVKLKRNIVVCGATGSGKTVLTRALLKAIDSDERLAILQDIFEIEVAHVKEVIYLTYGKEGQKDNKIPAKQSLAACMRLTPDRVIMTELRDGAALSYVDTLQNGHPGGIATVHADSERDAINRLAMLIKGTETGRTLEKKDIVDMLYSTIDIVVFMAKRKVKAVYFDPAYKMKVKNGEV